MNVSVVICAYSLDRWDDLNSAVRSCLDQSMTPHEVIVVIDYNDELLARSHDGLAGARVVANRSTKGLSGARNTGVATSSGDVIAFLDDDARAEPEWLEHLTAPFVDEKVAGVGGWVVPQWPGEAPQWFPETFYWVFGCSYSGLPTDGAVIRNPIGANMAMRRRVFDTVGGFTSGIGRIGRNPLGCEETELCIRYSAVVSDEQFVLRRDAVVHHRVPASRLTWKYFWTRCWAEGLSKAAVASLVGSHQGLAAERQHVIRAIPRELVQSARMLGSAPRSAGARVGLIVAGSICATAGLVRGQAVLRRTPLRSGATDLQTLKDLLAAGDGAGRSASVGHSEIVHDDGVGSEVIDDPSPVQLVQVDISQRPVTLNFQAAPDERLWVEVLKQGHLVGVVERRAEEGGLSESTLLALSDEFAESEPSLIQRLPDDQLPRATVVVPSICRRLDELVRTIESLLALDYPDFEIIVVDNRSAANRTAPPALPGGSRVQLEWEPEPGVSAARNRGVASATGDFIAFTDDDVVVDRSWLRALGTRFALNDEVDAIGGMVRPMELETRPQLWFEEFFGGFTKNYSAEFWSIESVGDSDPLFPYSPGWFGAGCNMALRRSEVRRIGGFDQYLGTGTPSKGGEDLAMFLQVLLRGGTIAFEPSALVRHSHRRTEREFMVQVFGYGAGLTAMYTALIVSDPRQLLEIVRRVPIGLRLLVAPKGGRSPSLENSFPRRTLPYQLLGMAYGPFAYARSRARGRRRA